MADDGMDVDDDEEDQAQHGSTSASIDWSAPLDELDAEDPYSEHFGSRDCLLFTVDLSKTMFLTSNHPTDGTALHKTLKAIRSTIISKIWSSPTDYLGILLYNTAKQKGTSFEHVYLYQALHQPGAPVVKLVDRLLDMSPDQIKAEFGVSDKTKMSDLFWACSTLFAQITAKLASRRIIIFTAEDEPHRNDANSANFAIRKASDVFENGVSVIVLPIAVAGKAFDKGKFWARIEETGMTDETPRVTSVADQWSELETQVRKRATTKRVSARIPVDFGGGLQFYVGVYNMIRTATKAAPIKLYRQNNQQVTSDTITMENQGGSVLMKTDLDKTMSFAGKKLIFKSEEVESMKHFGPPALSIIGFKPLSFLKPKYHIRPAQFIHPDDTIMKGSTKMFIALFEKCLEKKVLALCRYIPREGIAPKFVALAACEEQRDERTGVQTSPPGFSVIFLPFADDFRSKLPVYRGAPKASAEAIQVAKDLAKKLTMKDYTPEQVQNPALQKHCLNVESLALEYSTERLEEEMPENTTIPDQKGMEKRAHKEIGKLLELVYDAKYDPNSALGAKKRVKKEDEEPKPKKKAAIKKEVDEGADVGQMIEQAAEAGGLKKFTVAQLKEYCKVNGIKPEGAKKDDLMGAIETHLAGND